MNKYVILSIILLLTSCASFRVIQPVSEDISFPDLNSPQTKSVGEILLSQGTRNTVDGIEILSTCYKNRIGKGVYEATGSDQGFVLYKPIEKTGAFVRAPWWDYEGFIAQYSSTKEIVYCTQNAFGYIIPWKQVSPENIKSTVVISEKENSLQQSLMYTGRTKNIIMFSYREYYFSMVRAPYTVDVTYDLTDSDTISFQKARIKILSASNDSISYIVLSNFN